MNRLPIIVLVSTLSLAVSGVAALAQKPNPKQKGKRVTVQQIVEPAFKIEPIVQKVHGRRGESVPINFLMESNNRDAVVEVKPVALRQELTGMIVHDEASQPDQQVELASPSNVDLPRDQPRSIVGVAHVPRGESNFHSFGILVRDLGSKATAAPKFDTEAKAKTQAGVRFVTQYLLRVDMTVDGARGEKIDQLIIKQASVITHTGRPMVQAIIENPTDTPFQFEASAKVSGGTVSMRSKPFRLAMPIRFSTQTDERFIARILPKSRIRMEEFIPEAFVDGALTLEIDLLDEGRKVQSRKFETEVSADDFPAQNVVNANIGGGVVASPAQIELSRVRGGSRMLTFVVKNSSPVNQSVELKLLGLSSPTLPELSLRPNNFQLAPNATRKVIVTLSGNATAESNRYGYLAVAATGAKTDVVKSSKLPIALVARDGQQANLNVAELHFNSLGRVPAFVTTIANQSEIHFPLNAVLKIEDTKGQRMAVEAGFGKWLMPSERSELRFPMPNSLPPGEYALTCEIETGAEPIVVRQTISVSDLETAVSASDQTAKK